MSNVAVIDIGSNSIKVLVARREPDGPLVSLEGRTLDARISAGISQQSPRLAEEGMERGLAAIRELLALAATHNPAQVRLVATSAVRDAANGADFCARVLAATGHPVTILSGDEEANAIGRGLVSDPALADLRDFHVFDLGGGSLECLTFRDRRVAQAVSLRLGCVRLTERFVADPAAPLPPSASAAVTLHVRSALEAGGVRFDLPGAGAVFAGGTASTIRAIAGAAVGRAAEDMPALIAVADARALFERLAALPLTERRQIPGLPPARADVFPTALATMLAVAEAGGFPAFRHSFRNLRWGIAADLLAAPPA